MCLFTHLCPTLCDPMGCSLPVSSVHGNSPGKNTGAGCHALLQRIFPTQGSNSGLPCCRRILYCLNYQGSPRILEWVAYPFSRETSWPRNRTRVSCIAGGLFLPAELPGKPISQPSLLQLDIKSVSLHLYLYPCFLTIALVSSSAVWQMDFWVRNAL